jgi:predicted TIM-barrel fold metal-dependent hydrolase
LDAFRAHRDRLTGIAYFDPWDALSQKLPEEVGSANGFAGVKIECSEATGLCGIHPGARLDDPLIVWLWKELERLGMILVVDLGAVGAASYQTLAIRSIASEYRKLTIIVAHLGQPNQSVEGDKGNWRRWEEQIDLGLLPNVYFDTASLPAYVAHEGFPFPSAGRYLRMAVERIGPGKVMWGTDIPALLSFATYLQLVQSFRSHLQFLPSEDQALVFGGNAERVYFRKRGS